MFQKHKTTIKMNKIDIEKLKKLKEKMKKCGDSKLLESIDKKLKSKTVLK